MLTRRTSVRAALVLLSASASLSALSGPALADASSPEVPVCTKKLGVLAVAEPANQWWTGMNLDSPAALLKVYVTRSKCFTLVDRGKGLAAAQGERELAGGGELRGGANIGKGQMKATDYSLVPDIALQNADSGGSKLGGMLGGLLPHGVGSAVGGVSLNSKTADVTLALTDIRSTEQVALEQGHAKKTDLGWTGGGAGPGIFGTFASAGISSYANTTIGQVVAMAYLDAYTKLIAELKSNAPDPKADNLQQAMTMLNAGKLYEASNLKSPVVRELDKGMMIYPTGEKMGVWWKVTDELGNEGWIVSTNAALAH